MHIYLRALLQLAALIPDFLFSSDAFCSVRPDEIPDVPTNFFLLRGSRPDADLEEKQESK